MKLMNNILRNSNIETPIYRASTKLKPFLFQNDYLNPNLFQYIWMYWDIIKYYEFNLNKIFSIKY